MYINTLQAMNSLFTLVHGLFQYDSCSGDLFSSLLSSMLGYRLQQWNTLYSSGSCLWNEIHPFPSQKRNLSVYRNENLFCVIKKWNNFMNWITFYFVKLKSISKKHLNLDLPLEFNLSVSWSTLENWFKKKNTDKLE